VAIDDIRDFSGEAQTSLRGPRPVFQPIIIIHRQQCCAGPLKPVLLQQPRSGVGLSLQFVRAQRDRGPQLGHSGQSDYPSRWPCLISDPRRSGQRAFGCRRFLQHFPRRHTHFLATWAMTDRINPPFQHPPRHPQAAPFFGRRANAVRNRSSTTSASPARLVMVCGCRPLMILEPLQGIPVKRFIQTSTSRKTKSNRSSSDWGIATDCFYNELSALSNAFVGKKDFTFYEMDRTQTLTTNRTSSAGTAFAPDLQRASPAMSPGLLLGREPRAIRGFERTCSLQPTRVVLPLHKSRVDDSTRRVDKGRGLLTLRGNRSDAESR